MISCQDVATHNSASSISNRLIALVDYTYQKIFIRHVLTHSEYDKNDWRKDSWYK